MSNSRLRELEEIAKTLVEAREKLEKLQASKNLPGTNALHTAISHAHWLCHRIYHGTPPPTGQMFRAVCLN
jgi:hypothetical protein